MSSGEMMTFLNTCITGGSEKVPVPTPPVYLNHYLGAQFVAGHEPVVGDRYIGTVTLTQFPFDSYAGILNILSNLSFEYRFSTRFLFYDPIDAIAVVKGYEANYANVKFSIGSLLMGALGKGAGISDDPDAANRAVVTRIEDPLARLQSGSTPCLKPSAFRSVRQPGLGAQSGRLGAPMPGGRVRRPAGEVGGDAHRRQSLGSDGSRRCVLHQQPQLLGECPLVDDG